MENKNYKQYLAEISTFVFDVDGVLTDGTVHISSNGDLLRSMNVKDGYALKTAIDQGFNICIISGGSNEGVEYRLKGLGIKDVYLGVHDKVKLLKQYFESNSIHPDNVIFMGDDLPDYMVMQEVALPCCPQDAVPEIKGISKYISHKSGGKGAVRDIIEQVLKVQDKWLTNFDSKYD